MEEQTKDSNNATGAYQDTIEDLKFLIMGIATADGISLNQEQTEAILLDYLFSEKKSESHIITSGDPEELLANIQQTVLLQKIREKFRAL